MLSFDRKIAIISLQARFIAQIIMVGAQVVGRAFTQAPSPRVSK